MNSIVSAIKLMLFFIVATVLILFLVRFGVATVFMIKNGNLYFDISNAFIDSLERGIAIGLVLGGGYWILVKIKKK